MQWLVKVGAQALARPDGSSSEQTESWAERQALYRLIVSDAVSFPAISAPHSARTRRSGEPSSVRLILNDTTEIDDGAQRRVCGLDPDGRFTVWGFLHSALMRDPATDAVIGLAGQELFGHHGAGKRTVKNTRRDPERESVVMGRLIEQLVRHRRA